MKYWKFIKAKLLGYFWKISNSPSKNQEVDGNLEYTELNSKFQYFLNHPKLDENFHESKLFMFNLGFSNGVGNKKLSSPIAIARVYSQRLIEQVNSYLNGELNVAEDDFKRQSEYSDKCNDINGINSKNFELVEFYKSHFPRSFSLFLGTLYLLVAMFLFLADIPLAVELIKNGLSIGMTNAYSLNEISTMFVQDEQFRFNWEIIFKYWEVFLTAFGIAFFTVYIKIFFDEFVLIPYGHNEVVNMNFKKSIFGSNSVEANNPEIFMKSVNKSKRRLHVVKISILLATIVAIIVLSLFRQDSFLAINSITNSNTDQTSPSSINENLVLYVFLSITLLFPIMSGICLSYSLNCFQNFWRYYRAKRLAKISYHRLSVAIDKLRLTRYQIERILSELEIWKLDNFAALQNKYEDVFLIFFEHGYNLGVQNSDYYTKGLSFMQKIENWQNKLAAQKINKNLTS